MGQPCSSDGLCDADNGPGPAEGLLNPFAVFDRQGAALMPGRSGIGC